MINKSINPVLLFSQLCHKDTPFPFVITCKTSFVSLCSELQNYSVSSSNDVYVGYVQCFFTIHLTHPRVEKAGQIKAVNSNHDGIIKVDLKKRN